MSSSLPRGPHMAELQPATVESSIYYQFDVHEGPRALGRRLGLLEYRCLLSSCFEGHRAYLDIRALQRHRQAAHHISNDTSFPTGAQISHWVALGKPRPYDVTPQTLSKSTRSGSKPGPRPAETVDRNVYAQFDVLRKDKWNRGYFCLLEPCREDMTYLSSRTAWIKHRNVFHKIPEEENQKLPNASQIDRWVRQGKPRPSVDNVGLPPETVPKLFRPEALSFDMEIFKQVDIRGTDGKEVFYCLLDPCRLNGSCTRGRNSWILHRSMVHRMPPVRHIIPPLWMFRDWIAQGKPLPYKMMQRRPPVPRPARASSRGSADPSLGLKQHLQEPASAEYQIKDLFSQFDVRDDDSGSGRSQYFCLLPGCKEAGVFLTTVESLRRHRQGKHKKHTLEDIPVTRLLPQAVKGWGEHGNNADAARDAERSSGSAAAGPAQKKVRRSVDVANPEQEELVSYCDAASVDCDRDGEDDVDDQVVDQIPDYRTHLGYHTQMVEEAFGENSLPSHASTQLVSSEESTIVQAQPLTPDPIHTARDLDLNVALIEFDLNVALPEAQEET